MSVRNRLNEIAAQRILILDGAMGSLIQGCHFTEADFRGERFACHGQPLAGCNDLLCLTRPDAISAIHEAYLEAGADIIETCSFNSTAVSLADYGIGGLAYEISAAAASLARAAADKYSTADKPRFVAGSMGPIAKSASLSPDMNDPAKRGIYWDELEAAYYDNARGLLDGGADILIVETAFDTLNVKAALFAIMRLLKKRQPPHDAVPVIVSATVSDNAGRLLSGQNLEALCASVMHIQPWALGLNCSFGATALLPHLQTLAAAAHRFCNAPCLISAHPNAGLPNEFGAYDESPDKMAAAIEKYFRLGLVNIIGGCCGTTPAHIAAIAAMAGAHKPRRISGAMAQSSCLAGTELLDTGTAQELILIGERSNVAGSRNFLKYINEKNYPRALALVRDMMAHNASVINVGMDDALLDAEKEMSDFLFAALADPEIARVPFMIDSSRWNVIEAGLKCIQGKSLVNSISLKDGEEEFLRRLECIQQYGAAVVVMLIDENGQAATYERKIEIAGRAYSLLAKINACPEGSSGGFPPHNIVFDPNVLTVATGIPEHDSYALDFIRACTWIREHCPGVRITGGISNLSFSFRGNSAIREAMHSVFLKHAAVAGLNMAIVNPAALVSYNDIEIQLREAVEDVILNRRTDAAGRLLEIAARYESRGAARYENRGAAHYEDRGAARYETEAANMPAGKIPAQENWRSKNVRERIAYAITRGLDDCIQADVRELREQDASATPLAIVEGPLMDGIAEVGKLFAEGRMYLPQVLRSAMVMKKAVAALEPFMSSEKSANSEHSAKIVLATVKGDVHDIGKNIAAVVLGCNGHTIIDLGVMVSADLIVATAIRENAAIVGLSALISPSLDEMIHVAGEMEKRGLRIPLLIGGAAANKAHTALRIAPVYSGPVLYVPDAAQAVIVARTLLSDTDRPGFLETTAAQYREIAARYAQSAARRELVSLKAARANRLPLLSSALPCPLFAGLMDLNDYPVDKVIPFFDWHMFLRAWDLAEKPFDSQGEKQGTREQLLKDAQALLNRIVPEKLLQLRGVAGFFPAAADGDDVLVFDAGVGGGSTEAARFCFLRNQEKKQAGEYNPCLADFFTPLEHAGGSNDAGSTAQRGADFLGLFALSADCDVAAAAFHRQHDAYSAIVLQTLANTLTEAFSAELHSRLARYEDRSAAHYENRGAEQIPGIRPAFGYPISPDHQDKQLAFTLLDARQRCGFELTETAMIIPAASACGMIIFHPAAYYFTVGPVSDEQLADWAQRKGISIEDARKRANVLEA